jgi:hypothetical protein
MNRVAPSSFGSTGNAHSWSQIGDKINVNMHRPTPDKSGIHVTLMCEPFAILADDLKSEVNLSREDNQFTSKFCIEMCKCYSNEECRRNTANQLLSDYYSEPVSPYSGKSNFAGDGGVMMQCGDRGENQVLGMLIEFKNEMNGSKASPNEQNVGYFVRMTNDAEFAKQNSVCPAMLISIVGPHMAVYCAVNGRGPCVDPMTPVACALKAVKTCVKNLKKFYLGVKTVSNEIARDQMMYPYPREFNGVTYSYVSQVGDKLVFHAIVTSTPENNMGTPVGTMLVVKFTRKYCTEVHSLCFNQNRSALSSFTMPSFLAVGLCW